MIRSLIQFRDLHGRRGVGAVSAAGEVRAVGAAGSVLELAALALEAGTGLAQVAISLGLGDRVDPTAVELLTPIDHPDPAHLLVAGTGLTHLSSAEGRDKMHRAAESDPAPTDSMRMFLLGVAGGKPAPGAIGAQPEWFYKGDGASLVATNRPLVSPSFALDGGEEPEIAGVYLIDDAGLPVRLGFALGNEFSDHVTERGNYLWLAHSKLRQAALGPELLLGELPAHVEGTSRVRRGGAVVWEKPFVSGEANMSHSIANLEHHHFKYAQFRRPGDVHVHFFGTATLSHSDGVAVESGDVFEIAAAPFGMPLRNALAVGAPEHVAVRAL